MEKVTLKLSQDGVCKVAQNTTGLLIEGTIYVPYMEMPKVEGAATEQPKAAKPEDTPLPAKAKKEAKKDPKDALIEIFDKMDSAEMNIKQAIKAIVKLGYDETLATKVVKNHDEDEDSDSEKSAEAILNPKESKKKSKEADDDEDEKPAKKSAKKSAKKQEEEEEDEDEDDDDDDDEDESDEDEFVEASSLKKGDKVSVFWKDEDDWFDGVVKSTKGKVIIAYEDETEFPIDEKNNPKIKKLG